MADIAQGLVHTLATQQPSLEDAESVLTMVKEEPMSTIKTESGDMFVLLEDENMDLGAALRKVSGKHLSFQCLCITCSNPLTTSNYKEAFS